MRLKHRWFILQLRRQLLSPIGCINVRASFVDCLCWIARFGYFPIEFFIAFISQHTRAVSFAGFLCLNEQGHQTAWLDLNTNWFATNETVVVGDFSIGKTHVPGPPGFACTCNTTTGAGASSAGPGYWNKASRLPEFGSDPISRLSHRCCWVGASNLERRSTVLFA